jgi:rhodanese-related sulfurtransferase
MNPRRTIDELLDDSRRRLHRLSPEEVYEAARAGALVIDIRSEDEQRGQGALIPGAVHYPLSVVAWRLDPDVDTGTPEIPLDTQVVLVCRQGYSSSLAAVWLQEIGFTRATDMIGGVEGWLAAGLPVEPYPPA